ncbi:MAG: antA/AntB antirepressor family protein [Nitrospirae bacterium]|nr:antA/AntB antirepressor family protein [Nitrospirota bacterium]
MNVQETSLIPIGQSTINGETKQTVNLRKLHEFLGVGKVFRAWITERIEQYDFLENKDFVVSSETGLNPNGGRPSKEYYGTLDMAKELSMVERNAKGKQARQYFIECERRLKEGVGNSDSLTKYTDDPIMLQAQAIMMLREKQLQLEDRVALIEHDIKPVDALSDWHINKLQGTCRSVGALQRQLSEKTGLKTTASHEAEILKAGICELYKAKSLSALTTSQYYKSMMWLHDRKDALHQEMWSKGLFGGKVLNMPEVTI